MENSDVSAAVSLVAEANLHLAEETSELGVTAIAVILPATVVYDFKQLWQIQYPAEKAKAMPFDAFLMGQLVKDGRAHAKYAEDSAYRIVEKLVFQLAQIKKISPQDAAAELKVQLREQK